MSNRLCPQCGAMYVDRASTCADCGVALVDPEAMDDPRSLPEEDQLVYELASWTLDQRTEVAEVMAESGIPHAWEGEELYVHVQFEDVVDRLLEPIEYGADGSPPLAAALPLPDGDLTEYDLAEWSTGAREAVSEQLAAADLAFAWDGDLLLVGVADEEAVDDLLDELEESGALDDADERDAGDVETPGEVLEMLFLASDRLRRDPLDAVGLRDLATAMAMTDASRPPYGMDPIAWRRITGLADQLVEAETGEDDGDDEVSDDTDIESAESIAAELREMLRPFV